MSRNKSIVIIASICLITILACNLSGPSVVSGTNPDTAAATAALQTQVALLVASTSAVQTALAQALAETQTAVAQSLAETQSAMPTNTPEFTFTPTLTLTPTFTLTPTTPMVIVSVNTNCRTGPGEPYDLVGVLAVGKTAEVVGRAADGGSWIIRLPDNPAKTCWLWSQYATVSGNWQALPIIIPPPTPTAVPDFTFAYKNFGVGPGYQCYMFKVKNTGGLTWESYSITVQDVTQSVSGSASNDAFITYDAWCVVTETHLDLINGEVGTVSAHMSIPSNPTGDHFNVTLTLCSENGLAGVCLNKTINFVQ
jgi:hypothetical protein